MAAVTTIKFAPGIEASVSVVKVSGSPKEAKWETRKVDEDGNPLAVKVPVATAAELAEGDDPFGGPLISSMGEFVEKYGDPLEPELDRVGSAPVPDPGFGVRPIIPQNADQARQRDEAAARAVPAAVKTQRGVTRLVRDEDGEATEFVDLTDQLAAIDERVKLDGMEVVAAIAAPAVPRDRIRDAHYLVPKDDGGRKVLALIWAALDVPGVKGKRRALVVRWSKRTNQAIGVIVPRSGKWLELLEVEFAAAMKPIPPAARLDVEVTDAAVSNATRFVDSLAGRKADLDAIDDERRAMHAQLLEAARSGEDWAIPARDEVDDEIADLLAQAAAMQVPA